MRLLQKIKERYTEEEVLNVDIDNFCKDDFSEGNGATADPRIF